MGELRPGDRLGAFRIVDRLGSGGAGVVYRAERIDFPQTVAIKVFAGGFAPAGGTDESAAERNVLASLDHRNIVRVLARSDTTNAAHEGADATAHGAGRAYLTMEFVAGEPIDVAADRALLSVRERLRLLHGVCDAVSHAHRRLLVHGDLKPANVLVADGEPKLLDFGSARRLEEPRADGFSEPTELPGFTREWASPEQRAGERSGIPGDVWSLGLLARAVLAGIAPTAAPTQPASRLLQRLPAAELEQRARLRATSAPGLRRSLEGDGDAILLRALAPRPEDRYLSVEALGADLDAWAQARPIAARRTPRLERAAKWARRHTLLAGTSALLALALVGSAAGIAVTAARAAYQRRQAERQLQELVRMTGTLGNELYGSVRPLPGSASAQSALLHQAHTTLAQLVDVSTDDPRLERELASQYGTLARLELSVPPTAPNAWAAHAEAARDLDQAIALLPAHEPARNQLAALRRSLP